MNEPRTSAVCCGGWAFPRALSGVEVQLRRLVSLMSRAAPVDAAASRRSLIVSVTEAVSVTTESRSGPVKPRVRLTATHSAGRVIRLVPVTVMRMPPA